MKTKDLKEKIKDSIYSETPDVLHKIDFHNIEIEPKVDLESKEIKTRFRLSFILVPLLAFSLIVAVFFNSRTQPPEPIYQTVPLSLDTKEEIYTISSLSSVFLLHQNININDDLATVSFTNHSNNIKEEYLINENINILNQFLNLLEPIFSNNDNVVFLIMDSTIKGYQRQVTLSSALLTDTPINFTLYYNEKIEKDKTTMNGQMIFETIEYTFKGTLKEKNGKEKFELKAYEKDNHLNYIEVEQTKQNNKQKFEYSIYKNDKEIFEHEIEIEIKNDGIVVELEYETDTKEIEFEIFKKFNSDSIYVEYEIEDHDKNEEGEIYITVVYDDVKNKDVYHYKVYIDDIEIEFDQARVLNN